MNVQPWNLWLVSLTISCYVAAALTGMLTMQVYFYGRLFRKDRTHYRLTVSFIWIADVVHTFIACAASWETISTQAYRGDDVQSLDHIPRTLAGAVALAGVIIASVSTFFIYRLYLLSGKNKYIVVPMAAWCLGCVACVFAAAAEMVNCGSYSGFEKYSHLLTAALAAVAALDVCVTVGLMYFLRISKNQFSSTTELLDTLTRYTFHTGAVPCIMAIISLIISVSTPHELIFLAVCVPLNKIYANALLASLNSRIVVRSRVNEAQLPQFYVANTRMTQQTADCAAHHPELQVCVNTSVRTYIDADISANLPDRYVIEHWEPSGPCEQHSADTDKHDTAVRCINLSPLNEVKANSTASDDASVEGAPSMDKDRDDL